MLIQSGVSLPCVATLIIMHFILPSLYWYSYIASIAQSLSCSAMAT